MSEFNRTALAVGAAGPAAGFAVSALARRGIRVRALARDAAQADPWRGFLTFRESGVEPVLRHLNALPLASYFNFEVTELDTALSHH